MPRVKKKDPRREGLAGVRRVVVKIGSRALVGGPTKLFEKLAAEIAYVRSTGVSVVLVSSGAVAFGRRLLGFQQRPRLISHLQACAATGQSRLMRAYEEAFAPYGVGVGQLLLTDASFADRERYRNVQSALDGMLELNLLPIVNENDIVSTEEICFGDNDQLASLVTGLTSAELLVLLTDVDGVYDEKRKRIPLMEDVTQVRAALHQPKTNESRGGMLSKLEAARRAAHRGLPVVIARARDKDVLPRVLREEDIGTLILPHGSPLPSRKHWIAYALPPRGALLLDRGAVKAVLEKNRSLLPAGVMGVRGDFSAGELVVLEDASTGRQIARGLSRYAASDLTKIAGSHTREAGERLGRRGDVVVHRDDLAVLSESALHDVEVTAESA